MLFPQPQTLRHLADLLGAKFLGDPNHLVNGLNEIHRVEKGDLVFVDHPKYYDKALNSKATTILINKDVPVPEGKGLIITDDPFRDYNKLVRHFQPSIDSLKPVSDSAVIGPETVIFPGVYIGRHVKIGNNCRIHPNVVIYDNTVIGDNVIIHGGTVIGADAFYYKKRPEGFDKMISCGRVVIEDNVEIGALCTVDKGVSADTIIGNGSKLDNQVHVGHDSVIGRNCLIAAQAAIAGVVTLEDNVTLWGQVGLASDLTIGKGAVIMAQSGLSKSVEGGKAYFGSPASEAREKMKELVYMKRLHELFKKSDGE
jgi:UDP-3-O-[3-hydroxymyristoyl] glucosamine N-acyltransferase